MVMLVRCAVIPYYGQVALNDPDHSTGIACPVIGTGVDTGLQ
jgi:hypothetical protein